MDLLLKKKNCQNCVIELLFSTGIELFWRREGHKILMTMLVFMRDNFIFWQADVSNSGQIGASDAAAFLKKSGLKEGVLHKVRIVIYLTTIIAIMFSL